MRRRSITIAAAVLLVAAAAGGVAWRLAPRPPESHVVGGSRIGGPFTLVDQIGHTVTERDLLGKPTVVYFGFTYCPEVCPTTLASMTRWLKALGPDADKLNVVFISIDPQRDTPKQLGQYLSAFDHRIRGLTGTPDQVDKAAHQYLVFYQKVPLDGGGYTMDHSTSLYLMDHAGHMDDVIAYQEPDADAIAKLKQLIKG